MHRKFTTTLTLDSRMPSANSSSLLSSRILGSNAAGVDSRSTSAAVATDSVGERLGTRERVLRHMSCARALSFSLSEFRRRCSSIFQFSSAQPVPSLLASSRDFFSDGVTWVMTLVWRTHGIQVEYLSVVAAPPSLPCWKTWSNSVRQRRTCSRCDLMQIRGERDRCRLRWPDTRTEVKHSRRC